MYGASSMSEQEQLRELNKANVDKNLEGWSTSGNVETSYGLQTSSYSQSTNKEEYSGAQW